MATRIATICARAGSKGVPKKNQLELQGAKLIEITIGQAVKSGMFDVVAVSSDDTSILDVAQGMGLEHVVKRPHELSGDRVSKPKTIKHLVEVVEKSLSKEFETVVDLDITSPLRFPYDIEEAINLLELNGLDSVLSAGPSRRNPYFNMVRYKNDGKLDIVNNSEGNFIARQDAPSCFDLNGSINVWNRNKLFENPQIILDRTKVYEMKPEQTFDIDHQFDVELMQFLYARFISIIEP